MGQFWLPDEDRLVLSTWESGYPGYQRAGGARSYDAFQKRRQILSRESRQTTMRRVSPTVLTDQPLPCNDWWSNIELLAEMQDMREAMSPERTTARITVETDEPIVVMALGDTHIGAWSTDYRLLMKVTKEILAVPNLYLFLLGDIAHDAIKLRGVAEVTENMLPSREQHKMVEGWLEVLYPRVLAATWGNHDTERAELGAGYSGLEDIYRRACVYFGGIGHVDVQVGEQEYRVAVSHHFAGRSRGNPVYGPQTYLTSRGLDREIAMAGDSHVPGIMQFMHGTEKRLAVNCGTVQTNSPYAQRYFSLHTHPVFPVFSLHPTEKRFTPYWSLAEYLHR